MVPSVFQKIEYSFSYKSCSGNVLRKDASIQTRNISSGISRLTRGVVHQ